MEDTAQSGIEPVVLDNVPMPPLERAKRAAAFLKALSHETRLMILCILTEGERSVSDLEQILSLRQPVVSQQLARLRADGIVASRRDGKAIYYSLASPEARNIVGAVHAAFCQDVTAPN